LGKNYVIGDIQGCYRSFQELLAKIGICHDDHIWLVGDLVNRGPESRQVLRLAVDHAQQIHTVLGNHDLHLMRRYFLNTSEKQGDTLESVLLAPDREELLDWLTKQPFIIDQAGWIIVHAGIHPLWSMEKVSDLMASYNGVLATPEGRKKILPKNLIPEELSTLVTMRVIDGEGNNVDFKGPPVNLKKGTYPWFSHPRRISLGKKVIFGHWSALGFFKNDSVICLDSGCVWGRDLTGYCLEDDKVYSVRYQEGS
jgi:bis(5'-nucleosyl)-tetraphosphatase (symmetrical)